MSDSETATDCNEAKPLDERKLRAVDLLAIGRPITEIAAELSIDRVTLWRWRGDTCATMLFRHGLNAKQVQMWLGHHSPAFTLDTYVHLLPDDLPSVSFLDTLATSEGNAGKVKAVPNTSAMLEREIAR